MESIFDEGLKYSKYDCAGSNTLLKEAEKDFVKACLGFDTCLGLP